MNAPLTDDDLLDLLATALAPESIRPTPAEHEQLRLTLACESVPAERPQTPRKLISLRRLPHPVAAAVVVAALTTGGAAAAVKTDTLPGPLRSLASAVGLPVTSPALQQVDNDLTALRTALQLGDASAIRSDAAVLGRDLDALNPDDRVTVDGEVNLLLAQADGWLSAHPSVSGGDVEGGDDNGVTGGASGRGGPGSGSGDGSQTPEPRLNTSNSGHGGDDSSSGGPGPGSGSGSTSGEGTSGDGGDGSSGTTPGSGQDPATSGSGGSGGGSGSGDSGFPGGPGSSSSSGGNASSTSGGSGGAPSGSGSATSGDGGSSGGGG
jgi:hypothetical protein